MTIMSDFSAKIDDMKISWPLAMVTTVAITVMGVLAMFDKDVNAFIGAILLLLGALGVAELREIKNQTNGINTAADRERTAVRLAQEDLIKKLLESPALNSAPPKDPE